MRGALYNVTNANLQTKDHPRVCGEHNFIATDTGAVMGSSPRMRGAPAGCLTSDLGPRIIPAYAGSTIPSQRP